MVSTRRSGSLSGSSNKRPSSSEDKPPSPKRNKTDNGGVSEKSMPSTENPKELRIPEGVDPGECGPADAGGGTRDGMGDWKGETVPAVAVMPSVAEGSTSVAAEKARNISSSFHLQPKQNLVSETPWCKLLSQFGQNANIVICASIFTIGSSRHCNLSLKDQTISAILCKIKHTQQEGNVVSVLESTGSKGSLQVNGKVVKKNTSYVLKSGDEVAFGLLGNHAYIFQQLVTEGTVKSPEVHSSVGKSLQLERRSGDSSAVAGASILASLSSLRQDLSCWKSPAQTTGKVSKGTEVPADTSVQNATNAEVDGLEDHLAPNARGDGAVDIGVAVSKNFPSGFNHDCNVLEEQNEWMRGSQSASTSGVSLRCAVFREYVLAGIVDGGNIQVSFDEFPYYLSENTKNVLIAATFLHLKHKEHAKYTSELASVNPRILLSGPAGSEIYQEMLAKALAKYFGAKLLVFDSQSVLGGLSSKEAELLKDGFNGDKSCSCTKQSPVAPDLAKTMSPLAGEAETLSSSSLTSSYGLEYQPKMEAENLPSSSGTSKAHLFKVGDRIRFLDTASLSLCTPSSPPRGPPYGIRGKVMLVFKDNPLSKVGVRFDKPIPDGVDLGGLCEVSHGFFCSATDLRLDNTGGEDLDKLLINELFEAVYSESRSSPFILFMKDADKCIVGNSDSYSTFKSKVEKLPDNVVVIGSHTQSDNRKEKSHPGGLLFTKFGGNQTALLDLAFPDSLGKLHDKVKEVPKSTKLLTKLFPNKVAIHMPQDESLLVSWKHQLDQDAETLKMKGNLNHLRTVITRSGMEIEGLDMLCIKDQTLSNESMLFVTTFWHQELPVSSS
ncbi:hypothetical protein HS088_TW18G00901 [Tripterygium wilfordii]|uniref:FHA domain-containing protein n=1 Tax=Tripterygium wilfordii TaxID=458696 RepID=A0A7J7CDP4_TRIWF|nr:hypothetical protein HS088_TW18G00901 [Tripterygium wilfordii]